MRVAVLSYVKFIMFTVYVYLYGTYGQLILVIKAFSYSY